MSAHVFINDLGTCVTLQLPIHCFLLYTLLREAVTWIRTFPHLKSASATQPLKFQSIHRSPIVQTLDTPSGGSSYNNSDFYYSISVKPVCNRLIHLVSTMWLPKVFLGVFLPAFAFCTTVVSREPPHIGSDVGRTLITGVTTKTSDGEYC